jgi:hypothetical protein
MGARRSSIPNVAGNERGVEYAAVTELVKSNKKNNSFME